MKSAPATLVAALLLAACAPLQPPEVPGTYVLDARPAPAARKPAREAAVALGGPRARPGFDTARMAYVRRAHEIEYFAKHRWADTPARMLAPLLVEALEPAGEFRSAAPGAVTAGLRLEVEIARLYQDFTARPSRIRFTLRAQLVDAGSRQVVGTREFDEVEAAPSEDAYGGVVAANRALERLLRQVVDFATEHSVPR